MTEATSPAVTPTVPVPASPPAAPDTPLTPSEAASRLSMLRNDNAWGDLILKSDPTALAELRGLSRIISTGNDLDAMIAAAHDQPDINIDGQLSQKKVAGEIPSLREHLSDDVIKELLSGRESTPQELAAVKKFQAMRHSSKEWVDRYLAAEHDAVREQKLCSIVLMQGAAMTFLVPVFDVNTLACETIAVAASCEAAAVWEVLRNAAQLRYTGGTIERVEPRPEFNVVRDVWAERHRLAK